jgi:hypothetical protein
MPLPESDTLPPAEASAGGKEAGPPIACLVGAMEIEWSGKYFQVNCRRLSVETNRADLANMGPYTGLRERKKPAERGNPSQKAATMSPCRA